MATASSTILDQVKAARRVSVPIVAITTPDPAATIKAIVEQMNGGGNGGGGGGGGAALQWDLVEGCRSLNDAGKEVRAAVIPDQDPTLFNPMSMLQLAKKLNPKAVLFFHLANRLIGEPPVIQAVWNLRDEFKRDQRMLVLLAAGGGCDWPAELSGDIVVLDEPLPDGEQLGEIILHCHTNAGLNIPTDEFLPRAVEAVQGLPAFQAEQVVAMSLTRKGMDVPALWERKRKQIELTPGLKVQREQTGESNRFADIGGVTVVKDFLGRIMAGQARPNAVVFVDEIEKFLAGAGGAGAGDSSGVSQDQLGQLLSYMQDHGAAGCIFVGPPGAAKSAVAKAAGNEAGIPTIQLDLGAMKGSLVGSSEQNLRHALKVITSVSNGRSLWIATCNSIGDLPPELRRRFTLGTFFFDLPDEQERRAIWNIYLAKYEFPRKLLDCWVNGRADGADAGWTGAEIKQCCEIAWRLGCSLKEAAGFVVPVSRSAAEQLERLRKAAEGRFLSASQPGVYSRTQEPQPAGPDRRRMELED